MTETGISVQEKKNLLNNIVYAMSMRTWDLREEIDADEETESDMKAYYGDEWSLLYGVKAGIRLIEKQASEDGVDETHEWREHYEQYGYGKYGKGLRFGKQISFYEGRDFDISDYEEREPQFDISDYE